MSRISRLLACVLLAGAGNALSAPMTFNATAASLTPDSGYGVDAAEGSGTLLDVLFTLGFSAQNFALTSVGDSFTFQLGVLDFRESNGNGGILAGETDLLGVTASVTFTDPLASTKTLTAFGVATAGGINGDGVDYTLTWATLTDIAFGTGGLFDISLNTITFSATNDADKTLSATVTLRALPQGESLTIQANVPEPASLTLLAAGLVLAGLSARRRRVSDA